MAPRVKIVIPLYRAELSPLEELSIQHTAEVLHNYPLCFVLPEGLPQESFKRLVPDAEIIPVSDEWLGSKNGIAGYNRMMLSKAFYDLFADCEYILICHSDAWVFRDELEAWCNMGCDCIAAPWIRRKIYDNAFVKCYYRIVQFYANRRNRPTRESLHGKVGNGGFSLRRVEAFRSACERYKEKADFFLQNKSPFFNEDVFWATVPDGFRYPTEAEALRFAFDTHPRYCYKETGGRLPFGCHSWSKPRFYKFWKDFIPTRS